ncbi:unnamed protein product [Mytilus coruscus]|uniref:SGNH hydrolase-type esterase domain-containing protein n=1 Tax=Mytilus coruscus TaxID=42192 RepID=A0A6J8DT63_MYTCO|nr:unnamed protein product [Mytilus coruscus]
MEERKNKIESLESSFTALRKEIEGKEKEIISLKIHASRGDGEFQTVPISTPSQPSVILMGTSNNGSIDSRISPDYSVHKVTAYTIDETEKELQKLESEPNVIVLHSLTNELMNKTPNDCVDRMTRICDDIRSRFHNIKIVISLPTPRSDSEDHNSNGQLITILMKTKFRGDDSVILCDNSNLAYKGQVMSRYIAHDRFHLTPDGTAVLLRVELDMEEGDPTEVEEAEAADVAMDVDLENRLYTTTLPIIQTSLISSFKQSVLSCVVILNIISA